ncbi:DUF6343 family protein [Streptomyces sp. NPDC051320]|uniref:DUF6343 family protein n=1 Tax=Streptomyces sp. NPDC051320 TaxID=3154644 RepID=UPI003443F2B5
MSHHYIPGRSRRSVPPSRSGSVGRRSRRTGTEPLTAYSALGLRLLLSSVALPVFAAGTALLALWSATSGPRDVPAPSVLTGLAIACGVITVLTVIDLAVLLRRRSQERN